MMQNDDKIEENGEYLPSRYRDKVGRKRQTHVGTENK